MKGIPISAYSPGQLSRRVTFAETMQALAVVPDELWIMMLTIIAFWFGGRFIKRDLGKPRVSKQQLGLAREIVARRTGEAEGSMSAAKETRALPAVPVYRPADDPLRA